MARFISLILILTIMGCSHFGDPQYIFKDPHFADHQKRIQDVERAYLHRQIDYSEYRYRMRQLDEDYAKDVQDREDVILGNE